MPYLVGTLLLCTINKNCTTLLTIGKTYTVIAPPQDRRGVRLSSAVECTWIIADDEMPFLVNSKRFQSLDEEDV